jgi:hypothetical protein
MLTERLRICPGQIYWINFGLRMIRVKVIRIDRQQGEDIVCWRGLGFWFFFRRVVTSGEFFDAMVKK